MESAGEAVTNIIFDPKILESYSKPVTENDLLKSLSALEISLNAIKVEDAKDTTCDSEDGGQEKSSKIPLNIPLNEDEEIINTKQKPFHISANADILEPVNVDENLNALFSDLKIQNEENCSNTSRLIERGPDRLIKNNNRQKNVYSRCSSTELKEKLKHLSGSTVLEARQDNLIDNLLNDRFSNTININEVGAIDSPGNFPIEYVFDAVSSSPHAVISDASNQFSTNFVDSPSESYYTNLLPTHNFESFYDDAIVAPLSSNGILSSEYESCSSTSFSGSPPKIGLGNDEVFGEIINEEEVLDSVLELESHTRCNPAPFKVSTASISAKSQKEKIINYLKEGQKDQVCCNQSSENANLEASVSSSVECNSNENLIQVNLEESVLSSVASNGNENWIQVLTAVSEDSAQTSSMPVIENGRRFPRRVVFKSNLPPLACKPSNSSKYKEKLRSCLSNELFHEAQSEVYRDWCKRKKNSGKKQVEVIYVENFNDEQSELQSNLHLAVRNADLAKIWCLVECQKKMNGTITDTINMRDIDGKTALDYAIKKNLELVVKYLE